MIPGLLIADSSRSDRKCRDFPATFCALPHLLNVIKRWTLPPRIFKCAGDRVFIDHPKSFSEPPFPKLRMESGTIVDQSGIRTLEEHGVEQNEEEIAQTFVDIGRARHPQRLGRDGLCRNVAPDDRN